MGYTNFTQHQIFLGLFTQDGLGKRNLYTILVDKTKGISNLRYLVIDGRTIKIILLEIRCVDMEQFFLAQDMGQCFKYGISKGRGLTD
jgi:hypothetical protein